MKYNVEVYYNELGKKLTGKDQINLIYESAFQPTFEQQQEFVFNEIPEQMIKGFEFISFADKKFGSIEVGDLVKLTETLIFNSYCSQQNVGLRRVIDINEKGFKIENFNYWFDFDGNELSRRKKHPATLEVPTKKEIEDHERQIEWANLIGELDKLIEDRYHECIVDLNILKEVIELIRVNSYK